MPSASVHTRTPVMRRCRSNRSMPSSRSVARASIARRLRNSATVADEATSTRPATRSKYSVRWSSVSGLAFDVIASTWPAVIAARVERVGEAGHLAQRVGPLGRLRGVAHRLACALRDRLLGERHLGRQRRRQPGVGGSQPRLDLGRRGDRRLDSRPTSSRTASIAHRRHHSHPLDDRRNIHATILTTGCHRVANTSSPLRSPATPPCGWMEVPSTEGVDRHGSCPWARMGEPRAGRARELSSQPPLLILPMPGSTPW